jgi:hypothetical protein
LSSVSLLGRRSTRLGARTTSTGTILEMVLGNPALIIRSARDSGNLENLTLYTNHSILGSFLDIALSILSLLCTL